VGDGAQTAKPTQVLSRMHLKAKESFQSERVFSFLTSLKTESAMLICAHGIILA
jgi:hypothetical protein